MIPLDTIQEGKSVYIARVEAGSGLVNRLKSMGLVTGTRVTVIHNGRGPLIIGRDDLRFALGRGMSQKIFVREEQHILR